MNSSILHYDLVTADERTGRPEKWMLMLHGAFGQGRNWLAIARKLVERAPQWAVALVDLRLHGRSPELGGPHTLAQTAGDLNQLSRHLGDRFTAVLGHSFGGKVTLQWLADPQCPAGLRQAWIIDSTPAPIPPQQRGEAWQMLQHVKQLPGPFASRAEAGEQLEQQGVASSVAAWMTMNLTRDAGVLRWRFDLDAMETLLRDFYSADLWHVAEQPPEQIHVHFVKASRSSIIDEAATNRLRRAAERQGSLRWHELAGGHWLNAENPDGLVKLLVAHLDGG